MGFGGLSIATSGIRVAQRNLNITGHNISNAEVPGFSRQRIIQTTALTRQMGVSSTGANMIMNMGADWSEVHQIRNEFLDINFRNNVSQLQFYSTVAQVGIMVETIMGELHGAYPFQVALNNIWYAMQELTLLPDGIDTRTVFISTANTFLIKAQDVFNGLVEYQGNLDAQIREIVNGPNGINATVAAIAELNRRIRGAESAGERANDWRDERNLLLDHLATLIPIDISHAPNGDVNITSLGHHILTGTHQSPMGLRFIANESSFVEPVFTHSTDILSAGTPPTEFTSFLNYHLPINIANGNDRGRLLALLHARGTAPANHLSEHVLPPLSPEELARLAGVIYGLDLDFTTGTFAGVIAEEIERLTDLINDPTTPEPDVYIYTALRADLRAALAHDARDPNSFIRRLVDALPAGDSALNAEIRRDYLAQTHNHRAHMWSIQNSMIPQVQMNLDRIVNSIVTMINDALMGYLRGEDGNFIFYRVDVDGNPILAVDENYNHFIDPVTGEYARDPRRPTDMDGYLGIPLFIRSVDVDADERIWPISDHENPNRVLTVFTINNIRINPDFLVAGGHNRLALSLSGGPGDPDLLVALHGVWMSSTGHYAVRIGDRLHNVQDAYIRLTGNIATQTAEANSKVTTYTVNTDQAHNRRMSIKGVSMDEEMNAMLRFQFAFQAASRAFNMIDSMIDRLVNGTGRVGL